jgi:hypothetical protein
MDDKTQHPIIEDIKRRSGGSLADDVTDDQIAAQMLYMAPHDRAEALLKMEEHVATDDNTDLRKKAQLLNLTRNIRRIDLDMRKAGR